MKIKKVYEFNASDFNHLHGQLVTLFNSNNNVFDNSHVRIEVEL